MFLEWRKVLTIDIRNKPIIKYFLFGDLYFAEGLELALILYIIPIYLLEKGISFNLITLVSGIATIPWLVKFIWGGIVDYFIKFGRKKFIILGAILTVITLFILSFIDPKSELILFTILLFFSHLGILFIDVSTDAWAIEISKRKERGKINASMMTGNLLGLSLGAIIFALIAKNIGYNQVFLFASLIVILLVVFPLFVKEIIKIKTYDKMKPVIINEFKKKTTILITIFGFVLVINHGLQYIIPLFEKTILNLDIVQIGLYANYGIIWSVAGAFIGGYLSDKWGRKKVMYIFIIICMVFSAILIFVTKIEDLLLYAPIAFSFSAFTASFLALAMDITNPRIGATQFSIITSVSNIGEWIGYTTSGTLVIMLGFTRVFLYSAFALGPALLILYFIRIEVDNK